MLKFHIARYTHMKTEHSAGGVILRTYRGVWQVLLIKDMSGNWTFPKGKIETGETSEEAAVREIYEEVGIQNLTMKTLLPSVLYTYKRNGVVEKTVDYFLFLSTTPQKIVLQKKEGIQASKWINVSKALDEIGYPETYVSIMQKVQQIVKKL